MSEFSKLSFWFFSKILKSTSLRISMHREQGDVTCSLTCHVGFASFWNQKRGKLPIPVLGQTATHFQETLDQTPHCCMSKVAWQNHPQVLLDTKFHVENTCWKAWSLKIQTFPSWNLKTPHSLWNHKLLASKHLTEFQQGWLEEKNAEFSQATCTFEIGYGQARTHLLGM